MRQGFLAGLLVLVSAAPQPATEPAVRIGLTQNASTITIKSAAPFTISQRTTKSAVFTSVLAIDPNASGPVAKADLQYRLTVELDGGGVVVMPPGAHVRLASSSSPLE